MRMCLESVEQAPGTPAKDLPGGAQTVRALMARGKVEIQGEWHVFLPEHAHEFITSIHMDGCHWFSTSAACACGVHYRFYGERSLKGDPWSAMWMTDDEGDAECERCRELVDGARPRAEIIIARPERVAA